MMVVVVVVPGISSIFSGAPLLFPLALDSPKNAPLGEYCVPGDWRDAWYASGESCLGCARF